MDVESIQQWALGGILICLIALPSLLAFRKNNTGAATVAAACSVAAVLVFIPQVQSLQFGPLKAETRAKFEEVNATLAQLRNLASDLARVSVLGVVEQGAFGYQTLYAIREDIERQLTALHARQDEIQDVLKPLNPRIQWAFANQIQGQALSGSANTPTWKPLYTCTSPAISELSVEKFRACFNTASVSSPGLERMLEELAEFQRTGHVVRLDSGSQSP
jgi:hypothetical protein